MMDLLLYLGIDDTGKWFIILMHYLLVEVILKVKLEDVLLTVQECFLEILISRN